MTKDIRTRIEMAIVEEMNVVNVITQGPPEQWVPIFVKTLTDKLTEITLDEVQFNRFRR